MGVEIERKFLVKNSSWKAGAKGTAYRQGYLCTDKERTVRARIAGEKAYLTIKGKSTGASRMEFEYEIPVEDAHVLLKNLCVKPIIEKHRYCIEYQGFVWEVDEFSGENQGLIIAEIELSEEDQFFEKPEWLGAEVTGELKYYNSRLSQHPYSKWP